MKPHIIALLLLGALLAACSNEKIVEEPQVSQAAEVVHFTATLAPKSEGSSRAITTGEDGNDKEILNVSWKENEKIAIYYETNSGWATATATVGKPNADGSATFAATLSNPKPNGQAKFVYPATLHNGVGGIDESLLLNNQNGLLNTSATNISKNFDAATGTGTIIVNGNEANVEGNVGMKNEVCILKIALGIADENGNVGINYEAGKTLNIFVGDGHAYTITSQFVDESAGGGAVAPGSDPVYRPFKTYDEIYVAMLPFTSQYVFFSSVKDNGTTYGFATATKASLEAGKFYRNVPVTLTKGAIGGIDLRQGSVTASDGDIITSFGIPTANTITIPDGYTVTLRNVNIDASSSTKSAGIICQGDATIILEGTNSVVGEEDFPGIQAGPSGSTLTISGGGSLTAQGGKYAAGIGSGYEGACGNITITGGIIEATGSEKAAGIGCGRNGACHNITITNTVTRVTAHKGSGAPFSIGQGDGGISRCGTITIGGTTYYDGRNFLNNGQHILRQSFTYEP